MYINIYSFLSFRLFVYLFGCFFWWTDGCVRTPGDGDYLSVPAAQLQGVLVGSLGLRHVGVQLSGYSPCHNTVCIYTTCQRGCASFTCLFLFYFLALSLTPGMVLGMWICTRLDIPRYSWMSTGKSRSKPSQVGGARPSFRPFSPEWCSWDALTSPTRLFQVIRGNQHSSFSSPASSSILDFVPNSKSLCVYAFLNFAPLR